MTGTLCLLSCALAFGQPARQDLYLAPQLVEGLELVYRGWVTEEALVPGVSFQRVYKLENHLVVLGKKARHWDAAVMTVLRLRDEQTVKKGDPLKQAPASVRLELAEIDPHGAIAPRTCLSLRVPATGLPTAECGAIVEFPPNRLGKNPSWEVQEETRPVLTWQVVGTETCNGTPCLKLTGVQQSENWDLPRADQAAWRRSETVWLIAHLGIAYRVERTVERRDPARLEPTARTVVRYDLESRLQYPGPLLADRKQEILQTRGFLDEAAPLFRQPAQLRSHIDTLQRKIAQHVAHLTPTPYRQALLHLRNRLDAARNGELPAEAQQEEIYDHMLPTVRLGQKVPDFAAVDLCDRQSARLYRYLGRPILVFFYNPATLTGAEVLRFAAKLNDTHGTNLAILAMAAGDHDLAVKQHADMNLPFPILDGKGLHLTFGVDALPRFVILDGRGVLRHASTGWGLQTPQEVRQEIQRWLPAP